MDKRVRASLAAAVCACATAVMALSAQAGPSKGGESATALRDVRLHVGPIPGVTTAIHEAPRRIVVPHGSAVEFEVVGAGEAERVAWAGATPVEVDGCRARFVFDRVGRFTLRCEVEGGEHVACPVSVVLGGGAAFDVSHQLDAARPMPVDDSSSNMDLVNAYFRPDSIAAVHAVDGGYATSVGTPVAFDAQATWSEAGVFSSINRLLVPDEAVLANAMVEWRVYREEASRDESMPEPERPAPLGGDMGPEPEVEPVLTFLGDEVVRTGSDLARGRYRVEVGPPGRAHSFELTVYETRIEARTPVGEWQEGVPVTFAAATQPSGFESLVRWIGATKYGRVSPVTGAGSRFEVVFEDTFGPHPDGGDWQWIGVRADDAVLGQDIKACRVFDGFVHCPLGQAVLNVVGGSALDVGNIGNSGQDGVRIEFGLDGVNAFNNGTNEDLDPVMLGVANAGLEVSLVGTLNSGPLNLLGVADVRNDGDGFVGSADFLSIGCPDVLVEVFLGGVPQGNWVRPAGDVALLDPIQIVSVGQTQGRIEYRFDVPANIQPLNPFGTGVVGDEVHFSPMGCPLARPARGISTIECFELRGRFFPMFRITSTQVLP